MKRSFYPRARHRTGCAKTAGMYGPYLADGHLMAAICYIISALSRSSALRTLPGGDNLCMIMALGNVVLLIFSVIFLFYTNSFLIRRRRREFGLYNVLGMSKRNLARILTWETLLTAAIAIAGGLFFGVLLSKLIELAIVKMMGGTAALAFPFDLSALLGTAGGFAVIYALLWLVSVVRVGRSTAVALLRSEAAGEKPPRADWFLSLLGLILLGAAYYLAVSIKNPLDAITWFFVAVVLVIFATYLLMITTSVLLCRVLQKDKRYYYRANHFVSVSSMAYRMKRNGAGLASICISGDDGARHDLVDGKPLFWQGGFAPHAVSARGERPAPAVLPLADGGSQPRSLPDGRAAGRGGLRRRDARRDGLPLHQHHGLSDGRRYRDGLAGIPEF